MFDSSFLSQFLANLFATFLGVGLALWLNRRQEEAKRKAEETDLLGEVRRHLAMNVAVLAVVRDAVTDKSAQAPRIPQARLEFAFLDAILPRLAQVSSNTRLTTVLAFFRHSAHLLNQRLDLLIQAAHTLPDRSDPTWDLDYYGHQRAIADSIAALLPGVQKQAEDLMGFLDGRLKGAPPQVTVARGDGPANKEAADATHR